MYRGANPKTSKEMLSEKGGIITSRGVKVTGSKQFNASMTTGQPVKVYKEFQKRGLGPIGLKPPTFSFYDFLISQDEDDIRLRENYFDEWVFPPTRLYYSNGKPKITIMPEATFVHYATETEETKVRFPITRTQYVYVVLNPMKYPVQSFGEADGMTFNKMGYLVCIEVGDPTSGFLGNAFVRYAINLSTPMRDCTEVAAVDYDRQYHERPDFFYEIKGDYELEKWVYERWFTQNDHFFNSTIYPKIRAFMNI